MGIGARSLTAAVAAVALFAPAALAQGQAQQKELSEKSVQILMNYAWSILPQKFTTPSGKIIEVDKTKSDALVPVDTGRDVIKAGYVSAQAQMCEMWEEQIANFDALMARERVKNKWTDQQLLYITTLHRMTIHMAAGKLKVVEKGKDDLQVTLEPIEVPKEGCAEDRKQKVREIVTAYVKTAPAVPPATVQQGAAPPAAAPAPTQPVPAAAKDQKKK